MKKCVERKMQKTEKNEQDKEQSCKNNKPFLSTNSIQIFRVEILTLSNRSDMSFKHFRPRTIPLPI